MPRILIVVGVLLIGVLFLRFATIPGPREMSPSPEITVRSAPSPSATAILPTPIPGQYDDEFEVTFPQPGSVIATPLTITGRARGPWYFEGSFPVRLLDSQANVVVETIAQAQGEWMTEDFVPFIAELEFISPDEREGRLLFENDNPSGLPEHAKRVEIPIQFQQQ